MILYQITIPYRDNADKTLFEEHKRFETEVLKLAGGLSRLDGIHGLRRDGDKVYRESMIHYQIGTTIEIMEHILMVALECFPDQVAIYCAQIGVAYIIRRTP